MHAIADWHHPEPPAGGYTILRATSGRIATKRFSAARDGRVRKSGYGNERWFTLDAVEAANLVELATQLRRLERDPRAFHRPWRASAGSEPAPRPPSAAS